MKEQETIRKLKLQLRIERTIILLVALFFVGRWANTSILQRHYAVMLDGKPVAVLATRQSAQSALDAVKRSAGGDVTYAGTVTVGSVSSREATVSVPDAQKLLAEKLPVRLMKFAVVVGGTPVVALDSEADAQAVLEGAKQRYGAMAKHLMEEPRFKQQVSIRRMGVEKSICAASVDDAVDAAASVSDGTGFYTVADGDISGSIAHKFHISMSEFRALNGGKNLDKLKIGEQIRVSMKTSAKKPTLTVVVHDQETDTEVLPFKTENVSSSHLKPGKQHEISPGRNGERQVVKDVTYENGVRTGMAVVEEKTIRPMVPRRIAVGGR